MDLHISLTGVYQRKHPNYATLDEYIRWNDVHNTTAKDAPFGGLLEHLNHVYINRVELQHTNEPPYSTRINVGNGTSVWERILDILGCCQHNHRDFSWRLLNKDLGTSVTRVWGSRLSCPVDGLYQKPREESKHVTCDKLARFFDGLGDCPETAPEWFLALDRVKELTLLPDPALDSMLPDSRRGFLYQSFQRTVARNSRSADAQPFGFVLNEAQSADLVKTSHHGVKYHFVTDRRVLEYVWTVIIVDLLPLLKNLEAFRWLSDVPVAELVLEQLATHCRKLKTVEINVCGAVALLDIMDNLDELEKDITVRRFSDDCKLRFNFIRGIDYNLRADLCWIGTNTSHVDCLRFDRTFGSEASQQGPDMYTREDIESETNVYLDRFTQPLFTVRELHVQEMGHALDCLMSAIKPTKLTSLNVINCKHLDHLFNPLLTSASKLTHLIFHAASSTKANKDSAHWPNHVSWLQNMLNFLRRTTSPIQNLFLRGDFGAITRNKENTAILAGIQNFQNSLQVLDVINYGYSFTKEDLQQIALYAPKLKELAIVAPMNGLIITNGVVDRTSLGWTIKEVLALFKNPLILTIHPNPPTTDSASTDKQLRWLLTAGNLALQQDAPVHTLNIPSDGLEAYSIHAGQSITYKPTSIGGATPSLRPSLSKESVQPYTRWFHTFSSGVPLFPPPAEFTRSPADTLTIPSTTSSSISYAALGPALPPDAPDSDALYEIIQPTITPDTLPLPIPPSLARYTELRNSTTEPVARHEATHIEAPCFALGAVDTRAGLPLELVNARKRRAVDELERENSWGVGNGLVDDDSDDDNDDGDGDGLGFSTSVGDGFPKVVTIGEREGWLLGFDGRVLIQGGKRWFGLQQQIADGSLPPVGSASTQF